MNSESGSQFWMILLLGSYDSHTKKLLCLLKDRLSENFMHHPDTFLFLLLDDVDVFIGDVVDSSSILGKQKITIITEKYDDYKFTLYTLHESSVISAEDLDITADLTIEDKLESYLDIRYDEKNIFKTTILEKLKFIASASRVTLVLRDTDLTRGGEYIELVHLLANGISPSQIFVLKREGLELSEMAWEILDFYGVNFRPYKDTDSLVSRVTTVLKNIVRSYQ